MQIKVYNKTTPPVFDFANYQYDLRSKQDFCKIKNRQRYFADCKFSFNTHRVRSLDIENDFFPNLCVTGNHIPTAQSV